MKALDFFLSASLPVLILLHLYIAPYTKVEESFNIQATHDIIHWSPFRPLSSQSFDHFSFPGAVPRTFIGASLLGLLSNPILNFLGIVHYVHYPQVVARAVLGLLNALALLSYKGGLEKAFGKNVGRWWVLLLGSQFHVIFYASRTLPNTFAFILTTLAFRNAPPLSGPRKKKLADKLSIFLFVVAGVIFRSEIALLLGTQLLYSLLQSSITPRTIITTGLQSAFVALVLSVPIDSYFWRRITWPELAGFYFNAIQGNSSDWGTTPYGYYFLNLLPKLLLNPLIPTALIPASFFFPSTTYAAKNLVIPSTAYVAIYSLLPHKESRFIIYVVPPLTAAAALSASYIWTRRSKTILYRAASLLIIASVLASFAASTVMLLISSLNYPGGEALSQFHTYIYAEHDINSTKISEQHIQMEIPVHMDVISCMTGVTQFEQYYQGPLHFILIKDLRTRVIYDKTENEQTLLGPLFWDRFDYALMEDPGKAIGAWEVVGTVYGFTGIEVLTPNEAAGFNRELERIYAANNSTKKETGKERPLDSKYVKQIVNEDSVDDDGDGAKGQSQLLPNSPFEPFGRAATYVSVRDKIREFTGGWWIGPKIEPAIRILKRIKDPLP